VSPLPCTPALTLISAFLLSACASTPWPQPEPEAVPGAWVQATPHSTSAAQPVQAWWTQLGDAQLDSLIDRALAANADARVMAARLKRAQASADLASAVRRPELGVSTSAARERVSASTARDADGSTASTPAYRQSRFGLQADVRYEADLLGRLTLRQQAANAERAASAADLRAMRQWLTLEMVRTYAELRVADDRLQRAQTASALLEQLEEAEHRRLAAGLITRNDLRVIERQRAEKLDEQAELQRQRAAATARLAELTGQVPAQLSPPMPSVLWSTRIALTGAVAPDLPAAVIERRPDVAAAWQRVMAAHQSARSVHLERYPALTLTGNTGFSSTALRRWLTGDALVWVAQAALQAPLLDGGRNRARTDEALATVEELRAQHRKLVLQALGEVETALTATAVARQRVDLAQAELLRRAADRSSAKTSLAAGLGNRSNLLQAELAESMAHDTLLQRRHELLLAWAAAQKALGQ
jgi:NodT family efflux transporter outer membrane factor (OMF) lipoprotein